MSMTNALKGKAFVTWRGKKIYFTPLDLDHEGYFEEWLKERERRELAALKPILDPLDYHKVAAEWVRCAAAGEYAYTSENGCKALRTNEGVRELVRLMLLPQHPKIKTATVAALLTDCWPEIDLIIQDFFTLKRAEVEAMKARQKPTSSPATEDSFEEQTAALGTETEETDDLDGLEDAEDSGSTPTTTPTGIFLGGSSSKPAPAANASGI